MSGLLHRLLRDLRTARHIPTPQLYHRARFLVLRRIYCALPHLPLRIAGRRAAGASARAELPCFALCSVVWDDADAVQARATDAAAERFSHLGFTRSYENAVDWHDATASPLWAYQMQYLGALPDLVVAERPADAARHLDSWRATFESAWDSVAWHTYPASLRLVNICVAASLLGGFDALGDGVAVLVATHARYIEAHLERDVRGNHLLENVVALLVAARCVDGSVEGGGRAALALAREELAEQILADGTHFERAPMYHAIVLQRLLVLDAVVEDRGTRTMLRAALAAMRARLAWMRCPDGEIPLVGDSARDFGPPVDALLDTTDMTEPASDGVSSAPDAGLHILRDGLLWCMLDAGPVCPEYLPAHGQADALTVEVWIGEHCLVTDPGLHEYTGPERAWGRSSRAHSTITVDDRDSSEVYGSFRVGGREKMERVDVDDSSVTATLSPWGIDARLTRRVSLAGGGVLRVDDHATAPQHSVVRSRLHLHPDVEITSGEGTHTLAVRVGGRDVTIAASGALALEPGRCSRRFGEIRETRIVVLVLERGDDGVAHGWTEIRPEATP